MERQSQHTAQDQAESISTFAGGLLKHIRQSVSCDHVELPDDILATLERHLDQLPISSAKISLFIRRQLDSRAVELWNECIQLTSTKQGNEKLGVLSKVRTFAFGLLESAASRHGPANYRALDVALKAARTCLENEQVDHGLKILKIAAARLDVLEKSSNDSDPLLVRSVSTEYYMLRIRLAWLQGRPDIAEHLFSKVPEISSGEDARNVLETCCRVGLLALSNGEYTTAGRWLGRALDSSDGLSGKTDSTVKDMRLLVLHAFARANTHINTAVSKDHLSRAMDALKAEYGNVFSALVLRLEVLSREERPSYQEYFEALQAALKLIEVTDRNVDLVLYHIQRLKNWSFELAIEVFKGLLIEHLAVSEKKALTEQSLVAFIWMLTTSDTPAQNVLDIIAETVKELTELDQGPLSEGATHASLALIWRHMSTAISNGNFDDAQRWCSLVLEQPIFRNCSYANKAKLQRKSIAVALEASNVSSARKTLDRMDEGSRLEPWTLYLSYKVALLCDDSRLGSESLGKMMTTGKSCLLACAAEAQRLGKTRQAITILQRIIAGLEHCEEIPHVSALFQSTICLLWKEMEECKSKTKRAKLLEEICCVFEAALEKADKQESPNGSIFLKELFQLAYKLALKSLNSEHCGPVLRLLDISTKIATEYKQHFKPEDQPDLHEHYLLCDFLKAIKYASDARIQNDPAEKRASYQSVRSTVQTFRAQLSPHLGNNTIDWSDKLRTMVSLDFEAAIYLHQWDSLPSLIEETRAIATEKLSTIFMNAILCSEAPTREILRTVKLIICTNHKTFSGSLLSRYVHCLFQLALTSPSSSQSGAGVDSDNTAVAEAVLDQVLALARRSRHRDSSFTPNQNLSPSSGSGYSIDELQWLATTAFNRAVDFYRVSEDANCRRWAGKAIELAELVDGDGNRGLVGLLKRNLGLLSLD